MVKVKFIICDKIFAFFTFLWPHLNVLRNFVHTNRKKALRLISSLPCYRGDINIHQSRLCLITFFMSQYELFEIQNNIMTHKQPVVAA